MPHASLARSAPAVSGQDSARNVFALARTAYDGGRVAQANGRKLYSFPQIMCALAIEDRPAAWQMAHLRQLIAQHGFPAPVTARQVRQQIVYGALAVCRRARWASDQVDAWLARRHLPPRPESPDAVDRASVHAELIGRANAMSGKAHTGTLAGAR